MARVVVVDDSQYLSKQIKDYLESEHYEVVGIGHDGIEGFELYKKHRPDFITLDITMPNKDGRECLSDILDFDSQAKVLMISALVDKSIVMSCLDRGAGGFIEKPLKFRDQEFCRDFRDTIQALLE